ncbi:hypothetical protein EZS27_026869 [termite gut metagenome]|uniref:Uncharacterized protein n=1 Tax=termite gut metagenome TaxID=433724 RepID=A0A5J4QT13_9ZZZZ
MKTNDINKFIDFSIEAFKFDDNEFYEELGISKNNYWDDKWKRIKQLKLKYIAQANKEKNENLLQIAMQKIQNILESTDESIKGSLAELIHTSSPQFQFRNIEKLDKNDLQELLTDLDVIKIIEDLEKMNNDNQ